MGPFASTPGRREEGGTDVGAIRGAEALQQRVHEDGEGRRFVHALGAQLATAEAPAMLAS